MHIFVNLHHHGHHSFPWHSGGACPRLFTRIVFSLGDVLGASDIILAESGKVWPFTPPWASMDVPTPFYNLRKPSRVIFPAASSYLSYEAFTFEEVRCLLPAYNLTSKEWL